MSDPNYHEKRLKQEEEAKKLNNVLELMGDPVLPAPIEKSDLPSHPVLPPADFDHFKDEAYEEARKYITRIAQLFFTEKEMEHATVAEQIESDIPIIGGLLNNIKGSEYNITLERMNIAAGRSNKDTYIGLSMLEAKLIDFYKHYRNFKEALRQTYRELAQDMQNVQDAKVEANHMEMARENLKRSFGSKDMLKTLKASTLDLDKNDTK